MKCHYEILELSRTADDGEIKKAYRKLALKWHPDKNLDSPEEAKDQFQLVQQAYEVLSDPQERAWYDNHREQILRGGHTNYEDNSIDLFQFFTASCYKGFGDGAEGFYAVYSVVFNTIASEEIEFMENEEDFGKIPKFGNSQSDFESEVKLFYAYWESYCTKKSYAWLNPHNISEIRDRRILKIIEKDNKKVQQKARKERNDEIRSLVAFVRKRDKRVIAYKKFLEDKAQQNRLKSEQNRLEQIRRKNQEIEEQAKNSSNIFHDAYEEQLKKMEAALTDSDDDEFDLDDETEGLTEQLEDLEILEGEEMYDDDLYCVACDKLFKNEKSYINHESSKKHRQNIEFLKKEMKEEEETVLPDVNHEQDSIVEQQEQKDEKDEEEDLNAGGKQKQKSKKSKKKTQNISVIKDDEKEENENDHDVLHEILKEKEKDEDVDWGDNKKSKKGKSKAKEKPTKKAEQTEFLVANLPQPVVEEKITENLDTDQICVTCKANFPSKNKLFSHLKQTGHGVYIPKNEKANEKVKGKKKK